MEADPLFLLVLGVSLLFVGFAGFAEMALSTASRSEIRKLSEEGNKNASIADQLLRDLTQFLMTSMLLKTGGAVVAGSALMLMFAGNTTILQAGLAILVVWLLVAVVQVMGRAIVSPKPVSVACRVAPVMLFFSRLLWPASALLHRIGIHFGGETIDDEAENVFLTEDGLRLLINVGDEEETILESEKQMIASILEMDETVAREVMVPRIDMVTVSVETSLRAALDVIISAGHSRIPVFEGDTDRLVGVLYAKDLLKSFQENRDDTPIQDMLRPAHFVPASKKVNMLLREMQKRHVHLVMVVDEYGGTAGLVTIEDIIEEIVGEIQDEYDPEENSYVQFIAPDAYLLNSRCDVYSVAELLNIELPGEDVDTLGGLIYDLMGHVPDQGESTEFGGWRFTVLSLEGRRIDEVRAELISSLDGEAEDVAERTITGDATDGAPRGHPGDSEPSESSVPNLSVSD